eukprot:CCRYP_016886-RA/>CCRYP_016886-RA protein AED:0.80 eAED:0.80 QI:0/0/0/0.5/1/1/2/0/179
MIITWELVQALMPNQTLMKIHGEPTHKALRKLKNAGANLIAVDYPWSHGKVHLGELQDATTFLARNGAAYTPAGHAPHPYPNIPPGTITAERKQLKAENEMALGHWQTLQHDAIDHNMAMFLKGIDPSLPLSDYTRKQGNCQDFAADARVPISEATTTMVTTGTKHAIQCGNFTNAWKE